MAVLETRTLDVHQYALVADGSDVDLGYLTERLFHSLHEQGHSVVEGSLDIRFDSSIGCTVLKCRAVEGGRDRLGDFTSLGKDTSAVRLPVLIDPLDIRTGMW